MRVQPPRSPNNEDVVTLDIPGEKTKPNTRSARVLLLEDRDDFRDVLRDYLVSRNYEVTAVQSGVEGVREIMKSRFDLIICDMLMPNMGGEMFYWAVTRVRPATGKHFIFFSGHKNNPPLEFFFQRVDATVLYKPFKLSELDGAIKDVFSKIGHVRPQSDGQSDAGPQSATKNAEPAPIRMKY